MRVLALLVAIPLFLVPKELVCKTGTYETTLDMLPTTLDRFVTSSDPAAFLKKLDSNLATASISGDQIYFDLNSKQDAVTHVLDHRSLSLTKDQAIDTAETVIEETKRLGHDPLLVLAVMRVESNFNHLAISPVGAEGLMQVMPYTAEWFAKRQNLAWNDSHSFDPVLNTKLGVRYLGDLYRQFGRWDWALTAYNRGPTATAYILQNNDNKLPDEIHEFYAAKVLKHYEKFRRKYGHLPG